MFRAECELIASGRAAGELDELSIPQLVIWWETHEAVRLRRVLEQLTVAVAAQSEHAMKLYARFERRIAELENGPSGGTPEARLGTPLSEVDFKRMVED